MNHNKEAKSLTVWRGSEVGRENIGALKNRIGFWGPLYDNYNKEPPK